MKKIFVFLSLAIIALSSCKKSNVLYQVQDSGISFYYTGGGIESDSTSYSFAYQYTPKTIDTLYIKMILNGSASSSARLVKVTAGEGTTAIEGVHYSLPDFYLPANETKAFCPVVLRKTPDLNDTTVKLVLKVVDSKDIKAGAVGSFVQGQYLMKYTNLFKVNFTNRYIAPSFNWNYVTEFFGAYSGVKYQFMIQKLQMTDFRPEALGGTLTRSDLLTLGGRIGQLWRDYVITNGPLIDENNQVVTFPK